MHKTSLLYVFSFANAALGLSIMLLRMYDSDFKQVGFLHQKICLVFAVFQRWLALRKRRIFVVLCLLFQKTVPRPKLPPSTKEMKRQQTKVAAVLCLVKTLCLSIQYISIVTCQASQEDLRNSWRH